MKETYYRLERKRKKKRNTRLILLSGIAVVVCIGVIAAAAVMNSSFGGTVTGSVSSSVTSSSIPSDVSSMGSTVTSSQAAASAASSSQAASSRPSSSSGSASKSESSSQVVQDPQNTVKEGYDYSKPVAESAAVDKSFFNNTAIIGDSRAVGMVQYTGLSNAKSYAQVSCSAKMVLETPKIATADGKTVTIMQAIQAEKNKYKRVYIMLGLNEIGYQNYAVLMDKYKQIIDGIRASQENVDIYLQAVLPITKEANQKHSYLRKEKIASFNQQLQKLAKEKKVFYVDPSSVMVGSDGFLLDEAAASKADMGIHLNKTYCLKWLNYLKTHTVKS